MPVGEKFCRRCGTTKPVAGFSRSTARADGRYPTCRVCESARRVALSTPESRAAEATVARRKRAADPILFLLYSAKARARAKGLPFSITRADLGHPTTCPLLGIALNYTPGRFSDSSASLDRIVADKGYIPGNVWVVSYRANRLKNDGSLAELSMLVANLKAKVGA